jgi:hypothetical protein
LEKCTASASDTQNVISRGARTTVDCSPDRSEIGVLGRVGRSRNVVSPFQKFVGTGGRKLELARNQACFLADWVGVWCAMLERDWNKIRQAVADCIYGSDGTTRTVYRLSAEVAEEQLTAESSPSAIWSRSSNCVCAVCRSLDTRN